MARIDPTKRLLRELLRKLDALEDKLRDIEEKDRRPDALTFPYTPSVPIISPTLPGTINLPNTPNTTIYTPYKITFSKCVGGCTYPSSWLGIIPPSCSVCGSRADSSSIICGSTVTSSTISVGGGGPNTSMSSCEPGPSSLISC